MATVDEIKIIVRAETDAAIAKMKQLDDVNQKNTKTGLDMAKSIAGYTTGYGLAVSAAQKTISAIVDLTTNSIKLAAAQERVKMEFGVLTGSMETGNRLFAQMNKLAAQTPLEMEAITAAGKQLLSVGVPVEEITGKLRMLGDVAMGNPEKLDRLTSAFGQLRSKGVASMEQLNRFVEAGVPIMAELGKQTGKSGEELFKMVSAGKIGFKDVETALKNLTSEGGLYHDMMKQVAETTEGKFSTAMDGIKIKMAQLGGVTIPLINEVLDSFIFHLDRMSAKDNYNIAVKGVATADYSAALEQSKKYTQAMLVAQEAQDEIDNAIINRAGLMSREGGAATQRMAKRQEELNKELNLQVFFNDVIKKQEEVTKRAAEAEKAKAAAAQKVATATKAISDAEKLRLDIETKIFEDTSNFDVIQMGIIDTEKERLALEEEIFSNMSNFDVIQMGLVESTEAYTRSAEKMQAAIDLIKWPTPPLAQDFGPMPKGMAEAMELAIANAKRLTDETKKSTDATRELTDAQNAVAKIEKGWNMASGAMGAYGDLMKNEHDRELKMMEENGASKEEIAKRTNQLREKEFNSMKASKIAEIAINTAVEMSKVLATPWMMAVIGGLGAVQAGMVASQQYIPMAKGGSGTVTKPTLFLAGEAGPESFAFGGANNKLMGGGGRSYSTTTVNNTVIQNIGGSVIAERQVKSLAMSGLAQASRGY